jgi:hypothetical protein
MAEYELRGKRSNYKDIEGFFRVKFDFPDDTLGDGYVILVLSRATENGRFYHQLHG